MAPLRFGTLNINGCHDVMKRCSLFDYVIIKKSSVVFLQEMHSDLENQVQLQSEWKGQAILSHGFNVSASVVILFGPEYKGLPVSFFELVQGRMLHVDVTIHSSNYSLFNIYAPINGSK